MADRLITVREAAEVLGLTEQEVIDLVNQGKIPAYKIAGEFLRFSTEQIQKLKGQLKLPTKQEDYNFKDSLADFFYYNDFYIFSVSIIILILFFIFKP